MHAVLGLKISPIIQANLGADNQSPLSMVGVWFLLEQVYKIQQFWPELEAQLDSALGQILGHSSDFRHKEGCL